MVMAVDKVAQPDPGTARDAGQLVQRLNELRLWAGQPSLRTLRRLAGTTTAPSGAIVDALPTSTTSYLLNGRGLPRPPRLELIEAFVAACLRARERPESQIRSELDRWRAAWYEIAGSSVRNDDTRPVAAATAVVPPVGPARPDRPASTAALPFPATPLPAGDGEPDEPRHRIRAPRRAGWRRPGWPVTVTVAASATALAVAGTLLVTRGAGGEDEQPGTLPSIPPATELHRGTVSGMRDNEGIDLDTGEVGPQRTQGVDLTPWGLGNHVVTNSGALMDLLEQPGAASYERCARVPARDLTDQVRGLYDVEAGAALCVWTREGRVAMLTLTEAPSQQSGVFSFDFVVWEPEPPASQRPE